uniref:Secreted protein n=1 Tax=Opuntia streptacantha TaxID=393608 RepID=A0A7C9EBE1_OPUST
MTCKPKTGRFVWARRGTLLFSALLLLVPLRNLCIPAKCINSSYQILLFLGRWKSGTLKVFRITNNIRASFLESVICFVIYLTSYSPVTSLNCMTSNRMRVQVKEVNARMRVISGCISHQQKQANHYCQIPLSKGQLNQRRLLPISHRLRMWVSYTLIAMETLSILVLEAK